MLIDVTDENLFVEIESDLSDNLPVFMEKTGLAEISPCESFTLTLVPITAREGLDATSKTIAISRKGQSYQAERQQASPAPLVQLLKTQLTSYSGLTQDQSVTSGSNIANVMLKALTRSSPGSEITLIVFSDMIENNEYLNMYRNIPGEDQAEAVVNQLIDPVVMEAFKSRQQQGLDASILIVCKENQLTRVSTNTRDIRTFWSSLLNEIGLEHVQFVDNLSNINQ